MSISLIKDADKKIAKLVLKRDVQNTLNRVQDEVAKFIPAKFVGDMQKLFIHLAQIIAEASEEVEFLADDFQSAIKYLGKEVLKDKGLYKDLDALKINVDLTKDKIKTGDFDERAFAESIYLYHMIIGELVNNFDIPSLEQIVITAQIGSENKAKHVERQEKSEVIQPKKQEKKVEVAKPKKEEKKVEAAKPKKEEKKVEAAKPKKEEKKVEAAKPKKEEKKVEAAKPKKEEKKVEAAKPKKEEKKVEAAKPKKEEKKVEAAAPKKQEPVKAKEPIAVSAVAPKKVSSSHDKAKAVYVDEAVGKLTAELLRGDGWYEKGLSRKDFFQCMINVNFEGNGKYELKSAQVDVTGFKVNNCDLQELVKTPVIVVKSGESELDIEMDKSGMRKFLQEVRGENINRLPTQVSLSVTAIVKSGVKTKKLPCDVSCTF